VLGFESNSSEDVQLSARWMIINSNSKQSLVIKDSRLTRHAKGRSSEAAVAALSEVVGDFSREIAEAVRTLEVQSKPEKANKP